MHAPTGRDQSIDALRACALFGILVVNLPFFALSGGFAGTAWEKTGPSVADLLAAATIQGVFESKFILIFSALFGYGAWRQLSRYGVGRYGRRLLALGAFGVADLALLFESDILLPYAVLGAALILFRNRSCRFLVGAAIGFWTLAVLGIGAFGLRFLLAPPAGGGFADNTAVLASGGFLDIMAIRLQNWASFQSYCLWSNYPLSFAAMLFGFAAGRFAERGGAERLPKLVASLALYALVPAVLGNIAYGVLASVPSGAGSSKFFLLTLVLRPLFALPLSLVLLALGLHVLRRPAAEPAVAALAPAGKMSMTIYLGFSVVASLVFFGYGFGLYGLPRLWDTLWISAVIFLGFVLAARLWERRFGAGPAERVMAAAMNAGPTRVRPSVARPS
ncbi:uncharacterized protein JOD31_003678 [Methylopila capsulata]|uniref:DUF418 domain-containing protein n=1 Tax=Methylopila capsulata TaxID=61654 RepID=A0A9W6MT23_9HYPH|nr:DUF418 domain-containing protein [Methylopila capsulata]MBM7853417.1 uncharacterized protein [Methylopila capsulata]GLK57370.1 hypothetical protein GCM10008170_33900 [Methylopila capsulata]